MGLYASYVAVSDDEVRSVAVDEDALSDAIDSLWADRPSADIDKMWHGLHALLTGTPVAALVPGVALSAAIFGTVELHDGESGFSTVAAKEVTGIATALRAVDRDALDRAFDPARLESDDIYPRGWLTDDRDEHLDELRSALDALTGLYEAARDHGFGVLVQIA